MRLHFDLTVTQRLLDHSKAAPERSPICDQLYEGRFRRDGKDADLDNLSADNFPTAADVDPMKIPAGPWLVGDHGIYLMSNGQPPLRLETGESLNIVAHAPEADPRINLKAGGRQNERRSAMMMAWCSSSCRSSRD